jgi:hypothetical protein
MLDISKLACQGNIRESPVGTAARPGSLRRADLWAGKTKGLVGKAPTHPRWQGRAMSESGSTDPPHAIERGGAERSSAATETVDPTAP